MAIAIVYGISACVIATAVCVLAVFLATARLRIILLASFAAWVCDAFLYSTAFHLALPTDATGIKSLLFPAAVMALVSFLFNSLLTKIVASWRLGKRISWVRVYLPLSLNSFIAAGAAVLIASWSKETPWIPFAFAPVVFLIWSWIRFYRARLERAPILSKA
jgi:hypothetical protein